jgi:predicted nucleic acid binding AN1-type Zn finger protein
MVSNNNCSYEINLADDLNKFSLQKPTIDNKFEKIVSENVNMTSDVGIIQYKDTIKETKKDKDLNKRCNFSECNKKLKLSNYDCKCGFKFCTVHRYSFTHDCPYDHKNDERKQLSTQMVQVVASKINKI